MAQTRDEALGGLVKEYRKRRGLSQAAVAELLSRETDTAIGQNIVSELERGRRWTQRPELPAIFARILAIPRRDVMEAMGYPVEDMPEGWTPTFAEIVDADETLSRAAKDHLINQYGLLQLASRHEQGASEPKKQRRAG